MSMNQTATNQSINENRTFWKLAAGLFWSFYIVFLLSSIPHLAEWFRHLDGTTTGITDIVYWVLAYGKAIAVDGADVLLTLAFLRKVEEDQKTGWDHLKLVFILFFIFGFTLFSWYINWQYSVQFATDEFAKAGTLTFFGQNVGHTNPIVGSAFQLFALVFTFISDTILKKAAPPKTAIELEAEARELEAKATATQKIAAIKRETRATNLKAMFDTGMDLAKHVKNQFPGKLADNQQPQPDEEEEQSAEPETEKLKRIKLHSEAPASSIAEEVQEPGGNQPDDQNMPDANNPLSGLTGRDSLPIEKTAELFSIEIKSVKDLVRKGKLRAAGQNANRITVASIRSYQTIKRKSVQKPRMSTAEPQLQVV